MPSKIEVHFHGRELSVYYVELDDTGTCDRCGIRTGRPLSIRIDEVYDGQIQLAAVPDGLMDATMAELNVAHQFCADCQPLND